VCSSDLKGRMIGVAAAFNKQGNEPFTEADQRLLTIISAQSAQVVENARLAEEEAELGRLEQELDVARDIQIKLLPAEAPTLAGFDVAGRSLAARQVGGDYYDFFELPDGKWFVHDPARPQPKAVEPGPSPTLGKKAPRGAVTLTWKNKKWKFTSDGMMEATKGCGSQVSIEKFGSCKLHVEFATPSEPKGNGQGRGNSGVIIMGKYEIQVLDNWHNATYPDGQCASIYGQTPPSVNACRKPGEWQTFDITFHAPTFKDGKVVKTARVTVVHNGVKVQDNVELIGAVSHRRRAKYGDHPNKLPLTLQDHGNPVRYRNVWYVAIDD